jgi:hypothetical protein
MDLRFSQETTLSSPNKGTKPLDLRFLANSWTTICETTPYKLNHWGCLARSSCSPVALVNSCLSNCLGTWSTTETRMFTSKQMVSTSRDQENNHQPGDKTRI